MNLHISALCVCTSLAAVHADRRRGRGGRPAVVSACMLQKTGGGLHMWECPGGPRHHTCPPATFRKGKKPRAERMYGLAFWGMNNWMIRATDGVRSRAGNPLRYQLCLGAAYISTDDKNVSVLHRAGDRPANALYQR